MQPEAAGQKGAALQAGRQSGIEILHEVFCGGCSQWIVLQQGGAAIEWQELMLRGQLLQGLSD